MTYLSVITKGTNSVKSTLRLWPWRGSPWSWWSRGWCWAPRLAAGPSSSPAPHSGSRSEAPVCTSPLTTGRSADPLNTEKEAKEGCQIQRKQTIMLTHSDMHTSPPWTWGLCFHLWGTCCVRSWWSSATAVGSCRRWCPVAPEARCRFHLLPGSGRKPANWSGLQETHRPQRSTS